MKHVNTATKNNDWAPVSIMAHEIGHHLSGHTLTRGGSQPPIELEADKFSGFVLQKMGASIDDAKTAIEALGSDTGSPTHPKKSTRVSAIKEGWKQSCEQQGKNCSKQTQRGVDISATKPAATPKQETSATATTSIQPSNNAVSLPAPASQSIPMKFDTFIIDEAGILDTQKTKVFAQRLYDYAKEHSLEILIITTNSLHSKSADDYAYDMMRQMRVGKLEVGNGVVLVMAPDENQVGVALGAGVYTEFGNRESSLKRKLSTYLDNYKQAVSKNRDLNKFKKGWTQNAFGAADHIMRDMKAWEWFVRYQNLNEILAAKNSYDAKRKADGARYEPSKDPTWRKLIRVEGTLVSRNPSFSDKKLMINDVHAKGMTPMHFRTKDAQDLIVYFNPRVEAMMPSKLQEGKIYSIVGREVILHQQYNNYQFDAVSYAQVGF